MAKLYHIVAMAKNRVIGKKGRLPWHFSVDLKKFKEITMGSTVIMGRKTFESIGKPLPRRENFVLTHSPPPNKEGLRYFDSLEKALQAVGTEKVFVIGGESLYRQTMNFIDGIYLTQIESDYDGDAFYPAIPDAFQEKKREWLQEHPKIELVYFEKSN